MIYDKMKSRRGKNGLNFFEVIHDFGKGPAGWFWKSMWILQIITNLFIIFVQEDLRSTRSKQTNVYMTISIATTIQGGKGCKVTDVEKTILLNIIQIVRYKICIKIILQIWKSVWPKPRTTQDHQGL